MATGLYWLFVADREYRLNPCNHNQPASQPARPIIVNNIHSLNLIYPNDGKSFTKFRRWRESNGRVIVCLPAANLILWQHNAKGNKFFVFVKKPLCMCLCTLYGIITRSGDSQMWLSNDYKSISEKEMKKVYGTHTTTTTTKNESWPVPLFKQQI